MHYFVVEVGIASHYGDGVFQQPIFIQSENENLCLDDVVRVVEKLHLRDVKYETYFGTWFEVLATLQSAKDPHFCIGHSNCLQANTFGHVQVNGEKVRVPITFRRISWNVISEDGIKVSDF